MQNRPAPRSQFDYRDADERDRQRSSWAPHAQTCRVLAAATPLSPEPPPAISLVAAIESFAAEYHLLYGNVPSGYLSQNCRPPNAEDRAYQMERGHGHGRLVPSVLPISLSEGLVRVRPNGAVVSFEPPLDLSSDDEEVDDSDDEEGRERWPLALRQGAPSGAGRTSQPATVFRRRHSPRLQSSWSASKRPPRPWRPSSLSASSASPWCSRTSTGSLR